MMYMKAVILVLLLTLSIAKAQKKDSVTFGKKVNFALGTDLIKLPTLLYYSENPNAFGNRFEINTALIYDKVFFLCIDFGLAQKIDKAFENTFKYKSKGFYTKFGFEYSVVNNPNFFMNAGLKLGFSDYHYYKEISIYDDKWKETYSQKLGSDNQFFVFYEFSTSLNFVLLKYENQQKRLALGATPKLRIPFEKNQNLVPNTFFIPGYGGNDKIVFAFGLLLMYYY